MFLLLLWEGEPARPREVPVTWLGGTGVLAASVKIARSDDILVAWLSHCAEVPSEHARIRCAPARGLETVSEIRSATTYYTKIKSAKGSKS